MGLLTGLLTLPLAPVRGVVLIAEQLAAEAERQLMDDEAAIRRDAAALQAAEELGEISPDEYLEQEELLIARLAHVRGRPSAGGTWTGQHDNPRGEAK
jgi:hypothetical protein